MNEQPGFRSINDTAIELLWETGEGGGSTHDF